MLTKVKRNLLLLGTVVAATGAVMGGSLFGFAEHDLLWASEPVHSAIEMLAAIAAISMGFILLQRRHEPAGLKYYFPGLGFLGMGVLKGFHALASPGQAFVFFHSMAGLAGAIGFSLVWFSPITMPRIKDNKHAWVVTLTTALVGVVVMAKPDILPELVQAGEFTSVALVINVSTGLLFLISSAYFSRVFYRRGNTVDYLFVCLAFLLGAAGLVFWKSALWDGEWWKWHWLQLVAFTVVLGYVVHIQIRESGERRQAEEALRVSEKKHRGLLENLPQRIFHKDIDSIYVSCNENYAEDLGIRADEIKGKSDFNFYPPDLAEKYQADDRRLMAGNLPEDIEESYIHDGQELTVHTHKVPLTNDGGKVIGILGIFSDITERKKAEKERLLLERQIQHAQKLDSLGVLAGGIAHDFNNLLMAVLGNADLALHKLPTTNPAKGNILEIEKAARRAADLAKQMLAYSGKGRFVIEPLDFTLLVEDIVQLLAVSISKKITLAYNFAEDLPAFNGDATQIRQIIMNLIVNASEAIGEKGGVITLSTGVLACDSAYLNNVNDAHSTTPDGPLPPGDYAYFGVTDTGCGMDDETMGKIFDPFFTTKFTGRGLGMSAVLGIIRGHKGVIRVESKVGKGTTFKVLFPVMDQAQTSPMSEDTPPATLATGRGRGTVLIADDEEAVCFVGKEMLESMGFNVLTASDGREAVKIFREKGAWISFVFLDLTMPNMDGKEAFQEILQIDPEAKVILCSGYNEQDATQRFIDKGLAGFLQKPFNLSSLGEVLGDMNMAGDGEEKSLEHR